MKVRIASAAKELPKFSRSTKEILPYVSAWMEGQDDRFKRKVLKIFENAGVDKRYGIMDAHEVFLNNSFEELHIVRKIIIHTLEIVIVQKS